MLHRPEGGPLITYFTLGAGWAEGPGDWKFHHAFQDQKIDWARQITRMKAIPGVGLAPFQLPLGPLPEEIKSVDTEKSQGTGHHLGDPRDRVLIKTLRRQILGLRDFGVTRFRTRGLIQDLPTWPPSLPGTTSTLRPFYESLRKGMGEKSTWICSEPALGAVSGLVDTVQLSSTPPTDWKSLRDEIVRPYAGWFWLHNRAFAVAQADLALASTSLDGATGKGFTLDEARTWCAYLIVTGGPVFWSDRIGSLSPPLRRLLLQTLRHAGGEAGIPQDLLRYDLPSRWLRREKGRTYLGLFNWSDQKKTLAVNARAVRELAKRPAVQDLFTGESHRIDLGTLTVTLRPHQSFLTLID
ncbi:MAG: hypothetical protein ACYTGH_21995 [Planctomycetota bacterium]|jgi:hypothetical protein